MERITIDANGFGWTGDSGQASISEDGRYVAVSTSALEDPIDTGQRSDIYLIDRKTDTFSMVSLDKDSQAPSANSLNPVLSSDASAVAFFSQADDLITGQTVRADNVFVSAPGTGLNEIVTTPVGTVDTNGAALFHMDSFSGNGRYIGFSSTATDLSPLDTSANFDVYMYDRTDEAHEVISVNSAGEIGNSHSIGGSMSDNGRYVVFYSFATNLTSDNIHGATQVFLRDTVGGTTSLISGSATKTGGGNGNSTESLISANGNFVVYTSLASDLVTGDTNAKTDLFLWNRVSDQTTRIESGDIANTSKFDISDDGRYVVFDTISSLVATDTNTTRDIYVYDRVSKETALVSANEAGEVGDGLSVGASISGDGKTIVFESDAENLTAQNADTTNWTDVYATDNPLFTETISPNIINGSNGKDALVGTSGKDVINGLGKADTLNGKGGADVLKGGKGNDLLIGGKGGDDLRGGAGKDTASYETVNKGVKANLAAPDTNTGDAKGDSYSKVENLIGSSKKDALTGNNGKNTLIGQNGADKLFGKGGADVLLGGKGADILKGDAGSDRLVGGVGNDRMKGGAGADVFVFGPSQGDDVILDFTLGTDRLVMKGSLSILSLVEIDTDATGGVDATMVNFSGGSSVLLENLLGVTDAADLL